MSSVVLTQNRITGQCPVRVECPINWTPILSNQHCPLCAGMGRRCWSLDYWTCKLQFVVYEVVMGQVCSCTGSMPRRSETFLLPYLNNSINVSLSEKGCVSTITLKPQYHLENRCLFEVYICLSVLLINYYAMNDIDMHLERMLGFHYKII